MYRYRITIVDAEDSASPRDLSSADVYLPNSTPLPWVTPWPDPARAALIRLLRGLYVALGARNDGSGWRPEDVAVVTEELGPAQRLSEVVDPQTKQAIRNARRTE